jgi:hypothetical protein
MADWMGMENIPTGAVEWNAIHNANRAIIADKFQDPGCVEQTIAIATTSLNINWANGACALVTASTAVATAATAITINTTNVVAGHQYRIKLKQSTAGNVVWTFTPVIKFSGSSSFTLDANKWDWLTLNYDSVNGYSGQLATGFAS